METLGEIMRGLKARVEARGDSPPASPPAPIIPACPKCNDQKLIGVARAEGDFESPIRYVHCECVPPVTFEVKQDRLKIPTGLRDATFSSFKPRKHLLAAEKAALKNVAQAAQSLAAGEADFRWLTLAGAKGWGKTHLAFAILNGRIAHPEWGPIGRWATGPGLLAELRAGYSDDTYEAVMAGYQRTPLLILDELGGEYHKAGGDGLASWADEQLYRVLDHRYVEQMETVITMNVKGDAVHPRLRDRIMDTGTGLCRVFELGLPSYRSGRVVTT
jgi:DNA replication protein DnaC